MSKQDSCPRYHHYHHHHPRGRHHLHHQQRHHHRCCRHHLDHLSQEAALVGGGSRGPVGGTCIPRNMWGAVIKIVNVMATMVIIITTILITSGPVWRRKTRFLAASDALSHVLLKGRRHAERHLAETTLKVFQFFSWQF